MWNRFTVVSTEIRREDREQEMMSVKSIKETYNDLLQSIFLGQVTTVKIILEKYPHLLLARCDILNTKRFTRTEYKNASPLILSFLLGQRKIYDEVIGISRDTEGRIKKVEYRNQLNKRLLLEIIKECETRIKTVCQNQVDFVVLAFLDESLRDWIRLRDWIIQAEANFLCESQQEPENLADSLPSLSALQSGLYSATVIDEEPDSDQRVDKSTLQVVAPFKAACTLKAAV